MKPARIGIRYSFDKADPRAHDKVTVPIAYVDKNGETRRKDVSMTSAEKWVVESIAMRLFLDHKRLIRKTKSKDGRIYYEGTLTVGDEQ